jgi:hypothetical protein
VLLSSSSYTAITLACLPLGLAAGGLLPIWGAMVAQGFGSADYGRALGLINPVMMPFTFTGPPAAGWVFDTTGNYDWAFAAFLVALAVAAAVAGNFAAAATGGRPGVKIAQFIAQRIVAEGVRSVFAVAGASHAHLLDALDRKGLHILSSRHETGAVSSADGYARTRRGLGVALIVAEQGLPNAVGGLAAAFLAGSPVLVIAAAAPRHLIEPGNEVRDAGLGSILRWCKFASLVNRAQDLPGLLDNAVRMTRQGRPGPAVLFVPGDLLAAGLETRADTERRVGPLGRASASGDRARRRAAGWRAATTDHRGRRRVLGRGPRSAGARCRSGGQPGGRQRPGPRIDPRRLALEFQLALLPDRGAARRRRPGRGREAYAAHRLRIATALRDGCAIHSDRYRRTRGPTQPTHRCVYPRGRKAGAGKPRDQ